MISLVHLTTCSPSKLGDELGLAGYRVFEALALSEVLYLQEHESIDAVLIGADVPEQEEKVRQLRGGRTCVEAGCYGRRNSMGGAISQIRSRNPIVSIVFYCSDSGPSGRFPPQI